MNKPQTTMPPLILILAIAILTLTGCSYKVSPHASPAVNTYSSYDDKVPGKFYLVLDSSLRNVQREVAPSSDLCSAHSFPVDVGSALSQSVNDTVRSVIAEVIEIPSMPDQQYFRQNGGTGVILVRLKRFEPRLRFIPGFWSNSAIVNTDLVVEVTAKAPDGKTVLNTTAGSTRTTDGAAGSFCSNGDDLLSQNLFDATREAMERLAERLSNSHKLRSLGEVSAASAPQVTTQPASKPIVVPAIEAQPSAESSDATPAKQQCFKGYSDNYPDNDAINTLEAMNAAKCAAVKHFKDGYDCPNSVSVDHEFQELFGDDWSMQITARTKEKIAVEICIPKAN